MPQPGRHEVVEVVALELAAQLGDEALDPREDPAVELTARRERERRPGSGVQPSARA